MRVFKLLISLCLIINQLSFASATAGAISNSIVISQIQTGGSGNGTAGQEFVELYNNGASDIDITNWCVTYSSASDASISSIGCFAAADAATTIWVEAGGYVTLTSPDFETATTYEGDMSFNYVGGLSGTSGHIRLLDATKNEIDKLAWGQTALHPETTAASVPIAGKALQRISVGQTVLQDTDNNSNDFVVAESQLHASGLFEVESIIDLCPNIDDAQTAIPAGYIQNSQGNCVLDLLPLKLTELLPNAAGSDDGREYIEIYNPTDRVADLSLYKILVGLNNEKSYQFPVGTALEAGKYGVFYDSAMNFTLVNTSGRVTLAGIDDTVVDQTTAYSSPADDQSWALVNNSWQYTNQPTPGTVNLTMLAEEEPEDAVVAACPAGKYRHPLTNRCRNIEADAATATCDVDQYRHPETGRCRKVVTANVTPCKDGQYRSEETNRCRNIATASAELTSCAEGQERNPDTNRCRKVQTDSVPAAGYAVESVKDSAKSFIGWWALGGIGILALGYAGWEWRREISQFMRRVATTFTRH